MTKQKQSNSKNNPPGAARPAVTPDLLAQLSDILWLSEDHDEAHQNARIRAAQGALEDIAPGDGIEGMLAVQTIATHEAAMECLRRAIAVDGSYNGMEVYLKHAERLLSIYTCQTAVLDKHRIREARRKERAVRESQDEGRQDTATEALIAEPPDPETARQVPDAAQPRIGDRILGDGAINDRGDAATDDRGNGAGAPVRRRDPDAMPNKNNVSMVIGITLIITTT